MKKLATLGPKGTYSDLAALKYIQSSEENYEIEYFSSIKNVLNSISVSCDVAVLPIENFSEGFVSLVLDYLMDSELKIISEITLPIKFSYVTNTIDPSVVSRLYVQFVAKGQCSEYIDKLSDVEIISTESNIESLNMAISHPSNSAAIVPFGSFDQKMFAQVIECVNDFKDNKTRFLVLSPRHAPVKSSLKPNCKTSLVLFDDHDRPGFLAELLTSFSSRGINLTSIVSRPNKVEFGKYRFLIDINGHFEDESVAEAISEIRQIAKVKFIGSYLAVKDV